MKIPKSMIPAILGAALLTLPSSVLAQTGGTGGGGTSGGTTSGSTSGTAPGTTTTTDTSTTRDGDGGKWGWLGLLGLIGLAGMRRSSTDVYTGTGGTRSSTTTTR